MKKNNKEKKLKNEIVCAILEMYETSQSTKPIEVENWIIYPWETEDEDIAWVNLSLDGIIDFYQTTTGFKIQSPNGVIA